MERRSAGYSSTARWYSTVAKGVTFIEQHIIAKFYTGQSPTSQLIYIKEYKINRDKQKSTTFLPICEKFPLNFQYLSNTVAQGRHLDLAVVLEDGTDKEEREKELMLSIHDSFYPEDSSYSSFEPEMTR